MPNVTVRFDADTGRFRAEVDAATNTISKTSVAVAEAKNRILDAGKQQIAAAQEVGKSSEQLARIQEQTAQRLAAVTEQNVGRVISSLDRQAARQKAVAAEMANLGNAPTANHGVSDRMAASAAVRLGEGQVGIRSIESFISTIPGVAGALQTIFPLIGGAGLAGLFVEMGEKGVEAFQKVEHAASDTRNAFSDLDDKSRVSIDDLAIQAQKLQDEYAKLTGHPDNGMALALLEAKKAADALLVSLKGDRSELDGLLKEHDTGMFGTMLSLLGAGPEGTGKQSKQLLNDQSNLQSDVRDLALRRDEATAGTKDPKALKSIQEGYYQAVHARIQRDIDAMRDEAQRLKKEQEDSYDDGGTGYAAPIDNSQKIANIQGRGQELRNLQRTSDLQGQIYQGNVDVGQAKQDKANSKSDDAAHRKAVEAQWQAFEDGLSRLKMDHEVSLAEEQSYWKEMAGKPDVYAENLRKANEKIASENQTLLRERDAYNKALAENERRTWENILKTLDEADKHMQEWRTRAASAANKAALEMAQAQAKAQEAVLSQQLGQGQISRGQYASGIADVHTDEYAARRQDLEQQLALANSQHGEGSAESIVAKSAIDKADLDRQVQMMQDAASQAATTWQGALKQANARWLQDSQDTAKQVLAVYQQAVSSFNDSISNLMVGQKSHFADDFRGIGKSIGGMALNRIEAPIANALGMGKADGSSSSPFHVIVVGGSAIGKGIGSLFSSGSSGGSDDSSGDASGSSGVGGFFGKAIGWAAKLFGGGRAIGGGVDAGTGYLVGENGPEYFTPGRSGTITPNHMIGGGPSYQIYMNHGITPTEVAMQVHSVMQQYAPGIQRASVAANQDHARRLPTSHR